MRLTTTSKQVVQAALGKSLNGICSAFRRPWSRLYLVGDSAGWSLDWDMRELGRIAGALGIALSKPRFGQIAQRQSVFFSGFYQLQQSGFADSERRIAAAFFHGRPGAGDPLFDQRFAYLQRYHARIDRLQVTNRAFREVVLETGIDPAKVFLIPIGVNLAWFDRQTKESRRACREKLGVPQSAVVVGSFQKDGAGWGDGLEPKTIKGPDVFLEALRLLKPDVPELFVLLSGPARGYVKAGLERMRIPYRHLYCASYPDIAELYQCLDAYVVASRDEGGPKSILESMASGVPLVTTRVGQAADLVRHGENGWMVDVEDAAGLAHWTRVALDNVADISHVVTLARKTAKQHAYEAQLPLWRDFMTGFVEF